MNEIKENSVRAWLLAMRPKTLSAAVVPVAVATALAYRHGVFQWEVAMLCFAFAGLMQVASNLINDLFDFLKGTDGEERLGPERACAQGWISPRAMRIGIGINLFLASIVGLCLLFWGGWELVALGVACIAGAFFYTLGASYLGLGDVLVVLFFGFVPVLGTYYVQAGLLHSEAWWLGGACGCVIDTLLVVNNYRDRHTDRQANKRTLIVRFGERFGEWLYLGLGVVAVVVAVFGLEQNPLLPTLLFMPFLLLHINAYRQLVHIRSGRALNKVLGMTARNIFVFGVSLVVATAPLPPFS